MTTLKQDFARLEKDLGKLTVRLFKVELQLDALVKRLVNIEHKLEAVQ